MALNVSVLTPRRELLLEDCEQVVAPSMFGQITILPAHRALMTELDIGRVHLHRPGDAGTVLAITGGFLEVDKDRVIILVDTAETADEIDVERAKLDLEESSKALKGLSSLDASYAEELARFERAELRLDVALPKS